MSFENLIKPGTEVKFKRQFGTQNGVIKALWISGEGIQYQITYMNNGQIYEPYVPREMFDVVDGDPVPAGFRIGK